MIIGEGWCGGVARRLEKRDARVRVSVCFLNVKKNLVKSDINVYFYLVERDNNNNNYYNINIS